VSGFEASVILAWTGLVSVLLYIPYTFYLIWRLPHRGGLVEAMARVVLVPGKRRVWFLVLSTEGALFLLSGLFHELSAVGVIGSIGSAWLSPLCFIGAVVALSVVQWIGLRPSPLTEAERIEARASVPLVFDSLALAPFAPFVDRDAPPATGDRP
jgi:hypothetical protein